MFDLEIVDYWMIQRIMLGWEKDAEFIARRWRKHYERGDMKYVIRIVER
jgi:uncharacterized protein (UPF0305 family)